MSPSICSTPQTASGCTGKREGWEGLPCAVAPGWGTRDSGTPVWGAAGSQERAGAWPHSWRQRTVVTASRRCLVPQVWGTHLRQRPEIHPSLFWGQGSCHGAQDRCPENGTGGTTLYPAAAGRWVGSSSCGTGREGKGAALPSWLGPLTHGSVAVLSTEESGGALTPRGA